MLFHAPTDNELCKSERVTSGNEFRKSEVYITTTKGSEKGEQNYH